MDLEGHLDVELERRYNEKFETGPDRVVEVQYHTDGQFVSQTTFGRIAFYADRLPRE